MSPNSAITGEFIYDTGTAAFSMFKVGCQLTANLGIPPDQYTGFYQSQISPVADGCNINSAFKFWPGRPSALFD